MELWSDITHDTLPWYPSIAVEKCTGCKTCFKYCKNGVLAFNKTRRKVRVKYPSRCRPGCRSCARFCPRRAIAFQDEMVFVESYLQRRSATSPTLH